MEDICDADPYLQLTEGDASPIQQTIDLEQRTGDKESPHKIATKDGMESVWSESIERFTTATTPRCSGTTWLDMRGAVYDSR
jgi:hypothetical protein